METHFFGFHTRVKYKLLYQLLHPEYCPLESRRPLLGDKKYVFNQINDLNSKNNSNFVIFLSLFPKYSLQTKSNIRALKEKFLLLGESYLWLADLNETMGTVF